MRDDEHYSIPVDELAQRRAALAQAAQPDVRTRLRAAIQKEVFDGVVARIAGTTGDTVTSCACGGVWIDDVHIAVDVSETDDRAEVLVQTTYSQRFPIDDTNGDPT